MPAPAIKTDSPFWQLPVTSLLLQGAASPDGLSSAEAAARGAVRPKPDPWGAKEGAGLSIFDQVPQPLGDYSPRCERYFRFHPEKLTRRSEWQQCLMEINAR
jgi:hypothetical protein